MISNARGIRDTKLKVDSYKIHGADSLCEGYLQYASSRVSSMLAMSFKGFLIHGALPVPVVKDMRGKINR